MSEYRPDLDFETDTEELTPQEAHDRWESVTNLDAPELRDLKESQRNEIYLERASDGRETSDPPIEGGPLSDALHLATTPPEDWTPDERAEADEAINYGARTFPQFEQSEGEPLIEDEEPRIHDGEIALQRWAFDPDPTDDFP